MRRHISLSLALILGLVAALNTAPLFAMPHRSAPALQAGQCEFKRTVEGQDYFLDFCSDFSEGLEVAVLGVEPEGGSTYKAYAVQFTGEAAYIPERFNSQAMVVQVLAGVFAFRVQSKGVIVAPHGDLLERFIADPEVPLGADPEANAASGRTFSVDSAFSCDLNPVGQKLCQLDPDEFTTTVDGTEMHNVFVHLEPGDTVYLPDNSTCFVCNTARIDPSVPAELLIWTPTSGFDGDLASIAAAMATPPPGTPAAQGSGRIMGWMFNPGGRCH